MLPTMERSPTHPSGNGPQEPPAGDAVRRRSWGRRIGRVVALLGALYVAACLLLVAFEGVLLFHPTSLPESEAERLAALPGVEPLTIDVDGATLRGFFVAGEGEAPRPTVLYFGGNAEPVWRHVGAPATGSLRAYNRVYVSSRGYDRSSGDPSADALLADALAIHDHVAARDDVDPAAIVPWGLSLGSGQAVHVASERDVDRVILLAPYDRLANVAAGHYPLFPVRLLMRNDIDSASKAAGIHVPLLVVHGADDRVIPAAHGRALAARWSGPVELRLVPGAGHNDLTGRLETRSAIDDFL